MTRRSAATVDRSTQPADRAEPDAVPSGRSMPRTHTKPFQGKVLVEFDEPERSAIARAAVRNGRSVTDLVRRIVKKWLQREAREERDRAERQAG